MAKGDLDLESLPGVGAVTRQKLEAAGINSILDLLVRGPVEISDTLEWDLGKTVDLINKARLRLIELGRLEKDFITASELFKRRTQIARLSTGSKNLDDLLGGGVETRAITEFYGEFGTGKTQVCHTLAVTAQLPRSEGGLESGAVYVDTEDTFRPERIAGIAESRGQKPSEVLNNIVVAKAYNSSHQEFIVKQLGNLLEDNNSKLVIVDSAVAHYRAEFLGRSNLAERQQLLNRFMHLLLRTAELYDAAVVVTNQVQAAPDVFFTDPTRATGGHVVAHTVTYRLYLRKAARNARIARIMDSPYHPERETMFILNEKGVDDPPEEGGKRR